MIYEITYGHSEDVCATGRLTVDAKTDEEAVIEIRQFVAEGCRDGTCASMRLSDGRSYTVRTGYGPMKNPEAKQHPCMVPFSELPVEQQLKDHLFQAVVHVLADAQRYRWLRTQDKLAVVGGTSERGFDILRGLRLDDRIDKGIAGEGRVQGES